MSYKKQQLQHLTTMSQTKYRPEIDGLRAVAIIPVVLFHLYPRAFPMGFLGVDVFFVISGYLITGILLRAFDSGQFIFREFWGRRVRRLFPVMAIVVMTAMLSGYFLLYGDEWRLLSSQSIAALTSTANVFFWRTTGNYWGQSAESMPLLHTWSLAIEEQFYLLFPPSLLLLTKLAKGQTQVRILGTIGAASWMLMFTWGRAHPAAAFYLLPTRMWELLAGCTLAANTYYTKTPDTISFRIFRIIAGQLSIAAAFLFQFGDTANGIINTTLIVIGTVLLLATPPANDEQRLNILLSRPAISIGKISYSWYMWHWPVFVLLPKLLTLDPILLFTISAAIGYGSWAFIENRTRYLPTRTFVIASIALLVCSSLSILIPYCVSRNQIAYTVIPQAFQGNVQPPYVASVMGYSGDFRSGLSVGHLSNNEPVDLLVLGDSHGVMYLPAIFDVANELDLKVTSFAADGGTSPFFVPRNADANMYYAGRSVQGGWTSDSRLEFDTARRAFIAAHQPVVVVVCCRWNTVLDTFGDQFLEDHLVSLVGEFSDNTQFLLLGQPPELPFGETGLSSGTLDVPPLRLINEDPEVARRRDSAHLVLRKIVSENPRVHFLSIEDLFQSVRGIRFMRDGAILYKDDDHLNPLGAGECKDRLKHAVSRMLSSQ